ncbi:MAG: hypothetical protein H0V73_12450 [Chloroflexi bacterium]|nr:hypothetical protein [Chloroflexota bacterium]
MDASRVAITLAVLLVGVGVGRFLLFTSGRAGDGIATLFVPPDHALGWPHGVQESDEPWAWRSGPRSLEVVEAAGTDDDPRPPHGPPTSHPRSGSYEVETAPVTPVTIRTRSH